MSIDLSKVDYNTGLFLKELEQRKIQLDFIGNTEVVLATYRSHTELLFDIFSSINPFVVGWIINDKVLTKKILSIAKIKVAPGEPFTRFQKMEACKFAKRIGYPVVIKPTASGHGDYVYMGINNEADLLEKIDILVDEYIGLGYYLIEKEITGQEYRLFYANNGFFAAVHRTPAKVIGDGKQSLAALVQAENYRRMNPRKNCLCEIKMDGVMFDYLEKTKHSITEIPAKNEIVQLRPSSNVSKGGNCEDITDQAHSTFRKLANQIMTAIPQARCLGIDLICEAIDQPSNRQTWVVCELNASPGLSLHMSPENGKPRNVAGALADLLFPETIK